MNKKVLLMILDGWGISSNPEVSAISQAQTTYVDSLYDKYPNARLRTFGMNVGLPDGQMGNSEVGHINIGAGRIVYQDLAKINLAIQDDTLKKEKTLVEAINYAKKNKKPIHLLGLLSDGGVHSHINHLKGLINAIEEAGIAQIFIHGFTDGRDVDPKSGKNFIDDLLYFIKDKKTKLASIIGRYYAMDRDQRWERIRKAYELMVHGSGIHTTDILQSIQENYENGVTDEFLKAYCLVDVDDNPVAIIRPDDVVLFFNFRTDRGRQLTQALSQQNIEEQQIRKMPLYYVTMTNYDQSFENIHVIYNKNNIINTLGEVLSKEGKTQIRIAETEKYPHVTFFFNGGREKPFEGEHRILCPSPKVATYDLQPEMSAYDIRDAIIPELEKGEVDFVCLNFANPDMVGHTGDMNAAIKACEVVDACTEKVVTAAQRSGYAIIIIADHGNCDTMKNPDGSPNTAHTKNLVPIILIDNQVNSISDGVLGDIAPTILKLMNVTQPKVMTQQALI